MTARDLLRDLKAQGVTLEVNGDRLKIKAPAGTLTEELRERLAERKAELLEALRQEPCHGCERRGIRPERNEPAAWCHAHRLAWVDLAASYQRSGVPRAVAERRAFEVFAADACGAGGTDA